MTRSDEDTIKMAQKIGYMYIAPFIMMAGIIGSLANLVRPFVIIRSTYWRLLCVYFALNWPQLVDHLANYWCYTIGPLLSQHRY